MRRTTVVLMVATALIAAACGGDSSDTNDASSETTEAATETTAAAAEESSDDGAEFAIVEVGLGDDSQYAVIENAGAGTGSLAGFALCQAPSYHTFGDIELAPGEQLVVSLGGDAPDIAAGANATDTASIGSISADNGEIGLYTASDFGNSDAIVDYVEWGSSGHTRSSVATGAGIWPAGDFVATTADTTTLASNGAPTSAAADWTVG